MRGYRVGFYVVCMSLLLFSIVTVASAQMDDFADAERRALSDVMEHLDLGDRKKVKVITEADVKLTGAKMVYREHASITDAESRWETWLTRADISASFYVETDAGNDIGLEMGLGIFRTTTDEEDVDMNDWVVVNNASRRIVDIKNDTEANGWEFKIGLGYLHDLYGSWDIKQKLFFGRRVIEFKRKDFVYTEADGGVHTDNDVIKEKTTLYYIEYNPTFKYEMRKKWSLYLSPSFAYVPESKEYNDSNNETIRSNQGIIARCEGQLGYKFTKSVTGYIGGTGEWQYLEGDTKTVDGEDIEWPDNDFYTYGVVFGLTFDL